MMTDKATDHDPSQTPGNTADVDIPSPYSSGAPPPYMQQPGYPAPLGYQGPPGYQGLPGYQAPPGYPAQGYPGQGAPVGCVIAAQPGGYLVQPSMQIAPPDYQALSWFACLCCCWPLGIMAILKSNEVRNSLARGDFNSAISASNSARNFAFSAVGVGVVFAMIYVALIIMFFLVSSVD